MKLNKKIFLIFLVLLLLMSASFYIPFPGSRLAPESVISLKIVDRNGDLLREVLSFEGGRCRWVTLDDISPALIKATVAAEDKNFFHHFGMNPLALIRAVVQNISKMRIVSGASTITQQLVRNIYHHRRNIITKLFENWLAIRLEKTHSKEEILLQYLNRIFYGNLAIGIEAASRLYFDKNAKDLSMAESAFLAGLPRSPSLLNPFKSLDRLRIRQKEILKRTHELGLITKDELNRALAEPVRISSIQDKFKAPHFCDYVLDRLPEELKRSANMIHTTLDLNLQEKIENLAENHINSLHKRNISNVAVIILDNSNAEILAFLGSKDFFDQRIDGQFNGAVALRQPGSTLKPYTYGLALETGMSAATILEDDEIQFQTPTGSYTPRNYDKKYHGSIRLRQALACSYNIPAVSLLETIGTERLYRKLQESGFVSLVEGPSHYGIGLTLGNGEVTLLELVQGYSMFSRDGILLDVKSLQTILDSRGQILNVEKDRKPQRVFTSQTAYILTHILSDQDARIPAFGYNSPLSLPFPCAVKTGTSK
ncbi:transglycosylase domain-containing protein, partial [Acidobacteriota bacterium]